MQTIIMCGGMGTRLKEMTEFLPKPLIPIGGRPILWHIMKHYDRYGYRDFILALGYKQELFKYFFLHYKALYHDVLINTNAHNYATVMNCEEWNVILSDTGLDALKIQRLCLVKHYIKDDTFMLTYGDAVSDINLHDLVAFHKSHGKTVTITGVPSTPRFGVVLHKGNKVISFDEKPESEGALVNGGFMVIEKSIFDYIGPGTFIPTTYDLETDVLPELAELGEIMVYEHRGFWRCMDTPKDMDELQKIWEQKKEWRD